MHLSCEFRRALSVLQPPPAFGTSAKDKTCNGIEKNTNRFIKSVSGRHRCFLLRSGCKIEIESN